MIKGGFEDPVSEEGARRETCTLEDKTHTMARRKKNDPRPPPGTNAGLRNRASPARLVKLYHVMTPDQRKMVQDVEFGGLLQIACHTIPGDFANWLLAECFQAETMELVLPGRRRISLTVEAVSDILGLPNSGEEVVYELEAEAIKFISSKYNIDQGTAPRIEEIFQRVKSNKDANEDFLRSWLMLAVSTFLCPTTSLHISPRCYPDIVDLDHVKNLNWSKFVVNQLKDAGSKLNTKGSVKGCVLVLVILCTDALEAGNLHIPNTRPRVAAWSRKSLDKLIKMDTKQDGSFGKLKLKQSPHTTVQEESNRKEKKPIFVNKKTKRETNISRFRTDFKRCNEGGRHDTRRHCNPGSGCGTRRSTHRRRHRAPGSCFRTGTDTPRPKPPAQDIPEATRSNRRRAGKSFEESAITAFWKGYRGLSTFVYRRWLY